MKKIKLHVEIVDRWTKKVTLWEDVMQLSQEISKDDLFAIIDRRLRGAGLDWSDLKEAALVGVKENSTAVRAALALLNAINYVLGLKKLDQLEYPPPPEEFYPPPAGGPVGRRS